MSNTTTHFEVERRCENGTWIPEEDSNFAPLRYNSLDEAKQSIEHWHGLGGTNEYRIVFVRTERKVIEQKD